MPCAWCRRGGEHASRAVSFTPQVHATLSAFHAPQDLPGIRAPASLQLPALGGPNFLPGIALGGPAGLGPPMGAVSNGVRSSPSQGDLRQLWQMVTQVCTNTSSCHLLQPASLVTSGRSANASGRVGTSIAGCMCTCVACARKHVAMEVWQSLALACVVRVSSARCHSQQVEPGQGYEGQEGVSVAELKRVIEVLPLETSAVNAVAPRLALLDPPQFASLLTELARDNHAFRCGSPSPALGIYTLRPPQPAAAMPAPKIQRPPVHEPSMQGGDAMASTRKSPHVHGAEAWRSHLPDMLTLQQGTAGILRPKPSCTVQGMAAVRLGQGAAGGQRPAAAV